MPNNYSNQDRGSSQEYLQYLEAMDAISIEKVASASVFFEPKSGNTIVDVGMASGTSTAILAKLFPQMSIIGVDINVKMVDIANSLYQANNLSFRVDDGELLESFEPNSVNGFFNCSTIHHITSYNGYDSNRAISALRRQVDLLKENGVLVVRDFVKPDEQEILVDFSIVNQNNRPNDAELFIQFAKTARSLAKPMERGFPIEELECSTVGFRRFKAFLTDVTEFVRRKDYYSHWEVELQEEYGYFTQKDFEELFRELGLRIVISAPIHNQWIINNRYKGQFKLYDLSGNEMAFPATNYLIAGEKTSRGKQIQMLRHLPLQEDSFLHFSAYTNIHDQKIWDVVERPNAVIDILPYYKSSSGITVLAKQGYPRPLATVHSQSPIIDAKHYSGYIPECLTVVAPEIVEATLAKDYGIRCDMYSSIVDSLQYYTSPGAVNELVNSKLVCLVEDYIKRTRRVSRHDAIDFGQVQAYDAVQLLNTAQTGALLEARLELNVYSLFFKEKQALPLWLGEKLEVPEVDELTPSSLGEVLSFKAKDYVPSEQLANYLSTKRALFTEIGVPKSQRILEYVILAQLSSNTLLTLPVCSFADEVYVGLESRSLPVPQYKSGNSMLLTALATRLPKSVTNRAELESFISALDFGDSKMVNYAKLGEKYFPSIGLMPEQVYPFVIGLDKPNPNLYWVSIRELKQSLSQIEDAHLLIAICRLIHMLAIV